MRVVRAMLLTVGLVAAKGCAGIALTGGGPTGDPGANQVTNGVAYKTFPAPAARVRRAALKALDQMAMDVTAVGEDGNGWRIEAAAEDWAVNIELETLAPEATRMRVVVHKGSLFFKSKDGETGREIIDNTAETLDRQDATATGS